MAEEIEKFVSGEKTWEISLFNTTFRNTMIQLLQGYPLYEYYGIWETYFGKKLGEKVVDKLKEDGLLNVRKEGGYRRYSLTQKGVNLAVLLLNRRKVDNLKIIGVVLMLMSILVELTHLFLSYFQNPIF